ncbi:hypothetical protein [Halonotius roseus]|uniref:Uncharacterized protein n=1 Tax=Halonotius roseus TaxID=2511997 RepID=A0A544QRK0_9EURY|nr:hypothetical protein [Halonotius roseus]TQQ82076.1 hypothetical protein EWF95_03815 [Halonotius roseus]
MRDTDFKSLRREFLGAGLTGAMVGIAGCSDSVTIETEADEENPDEDGGNAETPDIDTASFTFEYDSETQQAAIEFTGGAQINAGNLQIRHKNGHETRWAELGSTTAGPDEDITVGSTAVLGPDILNWATPIQTDEQIRLVYVGKETPATLDRYSPPESTTTETTVPNSSEANLDQEEVDGENTSEANLDQEEVDGEEPEISEGSAAEWEYRAEGDANVDVVDTESLNLRVYKCNTAIASRELGETNGEIEIAFDYEVEAEQWFEQCKVIVIEDGEEIYDSFGESGSESIINHTSGGTETGSISETVSVDGDVDIEFRIEPSPYCNAGDHANTYFRVDNVQINESSGTDNPTAPSISAFSIANTGNRQLRVSFDSSKQLNTIEVLISGAESTTLTTGDFVRADNNSGSFTYEATYQASSNGTFTANLDEAVGENGLSTELSEPVSVTIEDSTSSEIEIESWQTDAEGDADVEIIDTTQMNLRVFKCNNATASTNIGETSGEIEIAFDYEVEAEQWFEQCKVIVIEDGEEIYDSFGESGSESIINHTSGGTETGSISETVSVDGDVDIEFRIEPSPYCNAGDHANTYFRVDNIRVVNTS